MRYQSTESENFLGAVSGWMLHEKELLVLIRFSHAAGARSWEFYGDFDTFRKRLDDLSPKDCIIVFRHNDLNIRGVVDDTFIKKALSQFDSMNDCLLVCLDKVTMGRQSRYHSNNIATREELEQELRDGTFCFGKRVAIGPEPAWLQESDNLLDAIVPMQDGSIIAGVY